MPDFDSLDYRYSDAPDKVKRSPVPGPNVSTVRLTRPVTDHTRAKALEVLRSYGAMDVAEMLGLT